MLIVNGYWFQWVPINLPSSDVNSGLALIGIGSTTCVFFVCKQFSCTVLCDVCVTPEDCLEGCLYSGTIVSSLCKTTLYCSGRKKLNVNKITTFWLNSDHWVALNIDSEFGREEYLNIKIDNTKLFSHFMVEVCPLNQLHFVTVVHKSYNTQGNLNICTKCSTWVLTL